MEEVKKHFDDAAQNFSEAKQIADLAIAEDRDMTTEEKQRYNTLWSTACDQRLEMEKARVKELSNNIATIQGEMAAAINGHSLPEQARRNARMYHEQYDADSVPYRWHQQGPQSAWGMELESHMPNQEEEVKKEWAFLQRRSSDQYRKDMESYFSRHPEAMRNAQLDLDEAGGYWLAPVQMINDILKIADNMVYIRQMAEVVPRVDAKTLEVVFLEDDVDAADWTGELNAVALTNAKWGKRVLRPKNMTKGVALSWDAMMQTPSLSSYLVGRLGYQRGITEERAYLTGNGVNEAMGVYTASEQGIPTSRDISTGNSATEATLVGVQSAKWSIRTAYWKDLVWFGAREFWRQMSLLRTTEGYPIWHMSLDMKQPDRLLGNPAYISEYNPAVFTSGKYVGIVGNFKIGYQIADAYDVTIQRVDQQFATQNLIVFIMRAKTDGKPVIYDAFARVTLSK